MTISQRLRRWLLAAVERGEEWREAVGPAEICLRRDLPDEAVRPLRDLLSGLRCGRLRPREFWQGWKRLPLGEAERFAPLRQVIEAYIADRERQATWDSIQRLGGRWPSPPPVFMLPVSAIDAFVHQLDRRSSGAELLPADAPDGRGGEASPAETLSH
jgi:hypothetical protein